MPFIIQKAFRTRRSRVQISLHFFVKDGSICCASKVAPDQISMKEFVDPFTGEPVIKG